MAKYWYRAVCDQHREMADVMVNNPLTTAAYLGDYNRDISEWLSAHYGCELRLVWRDDQLDDLWDTHIDMSKLYVKDEPPS